MAFRMHLQSPQVTDPVCLCFTGWWGDDARERGVGMSKHKGSKLCQPVLLPGWAINYEHVAKPSGSFLLFSHAEWNGMKWRWMSAHNSGSSIKVSGCDYSFLFSLFRMELWLRRVTRFSGCRRGLAEAWPHTNRCISISRHNRRGWGKAKLQFINISEEITVS